MTGNDWIACSIIGALMLLMSIMSAVLLRGKGWWMIAGFNTMDKKEREKYDSAALCRFMGKYLLSVTLPMIAIPIGGIFDLFWPPLLYGLYVVASAVCVVVYVNTGSRFQKKP